jgi:hypothetical protein
MTWASGFFRLWIVLALLWCGATVAMLGKDEFKELWQPRVGLHVEYNAGNPDDLDGSRSKLTRLARLPMDYLRSSTMKVQEGPTSFTAH